MTAPYHPRRLPPPSPEESIAENLIEAITEGRFLKFAEEQPPDPKHFLYKSRWGLTPLQAAADLRGLSRGLGEIFLPSYWAGRVGQMIDLWSHVPEKDRGQIDFNALRNEAMLESRPPGRKLNATDFSEAASSFSLGAMFHKVLKERERG